MSDEAKTAVVRLMVEHDPGFVHAVTFNDETALHFACSCDLIQAVCTLLDSGADINRIDMSGQSPLFYATNPNVVELLLSRGADVHNMDATGRTPLHDAVAMAREDIARLLIEHGADVRAQSMDGTTPLHEAQARCDLEITKLLVLKGADVHARHVSGATPLHDAACNRTTGAARVEYLLQQGADINCTDLYGRTPLIRAAQLGIEPVVSVLLAKGACVHHRCDTCTALEWARMNGHLGVAAMLSDAAPLPASIAFVAAKRRHDVQVL
eukprot:TRINITY_DN25869_c0_g1_i3.p1 TRINITY_DN25869_c0_g1~~TRINITY_DN25869_c0_g1_i3.p1  ORF type:complete len:308 (+),score=70.54 TRINITY_DN25869_c0_g1_i3:122-925(+)